MERDGWRGLGPSPTFLSLKGRECDGWRRARRRRPWTREGKNGGSRRGGERGAWSLELGAGSVGLDGRTAESNRENCIRSNNAVLVAAALPSSAPPYPPYPPLAVLEPLPTHPPREPQTPTCIESVCDSVKNAMVRGSRPREPRESTDQTNGSANIHTATNGGVFFCCSKCYGWNNTHRHARMFVHGVALATCHVVCLQCNCLQGCVMNTTTRRIRRGRAQNSLYGNPL